MSATRIYISGPMTGLLDLNFPAFNAAAQKLRALGYEVVNPAEITPQGDATWNTCMRADIKALCDCGAVALLDGWNDSKGAKLEVHIAMHLQMRIFRLSDWLSTPEPQLAHSEAAKV